MNVHWILRRVLWSMFGILFGLCLSCVFWWFFGDSEPAVVIERPTDCDDFAYSSPTGVRNIDLGHRNVSVLCDIGKDGRWTVIMKRSIRLPDVDFDRNWTAYRDGFGSLKAAFWLGNEWVHRLTSRRGWRYELNVELQDAEGAAMHAHYLGFRVGPEWDNYRLHLGSYSGTAGDSLSFVNKMQFSTPEKDHDLHPTHNCAGYDGPFWHRNCGLTYLTIHDVHNMHWIRKTGTANIYLHKVVMKIRPYIRPKHKYKGKLLVGGYAWWPLGWLFG